MKLISLEIVSCQSPQTGMSRKSKCGKQPSYFCDQLQSESKDTFLKLSSSSFIELIKQTFCSGRINLQSACTKYSRENLYLLTALMQPFFLKVQIHLVLAIRVHRSKVTKTFGPCEALATDAHLLPCVYSHDQTDCQGERTAKYY